MTFSASSIEQWCRMSTLKSVGEDPVRQRICSRRQLARPAVVLSVRDQMSLIPPVDFDSSAILPPVMVLSNSIINSSAMACFRAAKSLRWARKIAGVGAEASAPALGCFTGEFAFFLGDIVGDGG